ncbi:hypothetical protein A3F06_01535 [candidate division TM6 bacterium RIFCSPHIGHO2_12_FULL_36_22]|nr:MAG: hypothetical protein A3F06_01535 [candidate division TM6 bacterium RIFCSPHIGHO2_12_FULL_36_22]
MKKIYPSLIAAKLLEAKQEIEKLEQYCAGFHLDVMDNHFVPNLTFGASFVNEVARVTTKQLFVHLMIDNPFEFLDQVKLKKGDILSIQYASMQDIPHMLNAIKKKDLLVSIAINPDISLEKIYPYIKTLDQVVIMSVKAGFSGQSFIPETIKKARALVAYRQEYNLTFDICMDGGINSNNIQELAHLGVDSFVVGSGIFNTPDPLMELHKLNTLIN